MMFWALVEGVLNGFALAFGQPRANASPAAERAALRVFVAVAAAFALLGVFLVVVGDDLVQRIAGGVCAAVMVGIAWWAVRKLRGRDEAA